MTLEEKYKMVRAALVALVGISSKGELLEMRTHVFNDPEADEDDKMAALAGIQALLETIDD